MLTQASNLLDDSTGIEKTLRLVQGLCTVLAGLLPTAAEAALWAAAKSQINLGNYQKPTTHGGCKVLTPDH